MHFMMYREFIGSEYPGQNLYTFENKVTGASLWTHKLSSLLNSAILFGSDSCLAEMLVTSPQKIYIFIVYGYIFWIKVSTKTFSLLLKIEAATVWQCRTYGVTVKPIERIPNVGTCVSAGNPLDQNHVLQTYPTLCCTMKRGGFYSNLSNIG